MLVRNVLGGGGICSSLSLPPFYASTHLRTQIHMLSYNDLLGRAAEMKAKENSLYAAMLFFVIFMKSTSIKVTHFSKVFYYPSFHVSKFSEESVLRYIPCIRLLVSNTGSWKMELWHWRSSTMENHSY